MDNISRPDLANRKVNPFGVKLARQELSLRKEEQYEDLETRTEKAFDTNTEEFGDIDKAIKILKSRLKGKTFDNKDFGYVKDIELKDLVINVMNQRWVDWKHVAYIIAMFDPRVVQVVNCIKLPDGRYSVPEGQHTAIGLYILWKFGIIPADFKVVCKVVDHELIVPGSPLKGEGFGNLLFRIINHKGRKAVDPYFLHRSRVNGVEMYKSELREDVHAKVINDSLTDNNMFARPAVEARGQGATPGMVTYLAGLYGIAEHDSEEFDEAINDLDWALGCHDEMFDREKGVDGGFILALGRYANLARKTDVNISQSHRKDLLNFFVEKYRSPKAYHKECKKRLKDFQRRNILNEQWSDKCLLSILIMDFDKWCNKHGLSYPMLNDKNINQFQDI